MISSILNYKEYIAYKASVLLRAKTKGTFLGNLWFIINPAFQILVYYFFTEVVFKASSFHGQSSFLIIVVGIFHYTFLSQLLGEAPSSIRSEESILMQMPIDPLVFVAAFFYRVIKESLPSFFVTIIFYAFLIKNIPTAIIFYPIVLLVFLIFCWSLAVIFSTLGVFYLDTAPIIQLLLKVLIFLCPVVYPLSILPEKVQIILSYNPLTALFSCFQWSLLGFPLPSTSSLLVNAIFILLTFILGNYLYARSRFEFTKVL